MAQIPCREMNAAKQAARAALSSGCNLDQLFTLARMHSKLINSAKIGLHRLHTASSTLEVS